MRSARRSTWQPWTSWLRMPLMTSARVRPQNAVATFWYCPSLYPALRSMAENAFEDQRAGVPKQVIALLPPQLPGHRPLLPWPHCTPLLWCLLMPLATDANPLHQDGDALHSLLATLTTTPCPLNNTPQTSPRTRRRQPPLPAHRRAAPDPAGRLGQAHPGHHQDRAGPGRHHCAAVLSTLC